MRGIMKFDDYNYSNYNSYILIEQPSHLEKQKIIEDRKKLNSLNGEQLLTSELNKQMQDMIFKEENL